MGRSKDEMIAWECPNCHRWHPIHASRCRCGHIRQRAMFSGHVVASLIVAIGMLLAVLAGVARENAWLTQSGAAIEAEMVWGQR